MLGVSQWRSGAYMPCICLMLFDPAFQALSSPSFTKAEFYSEAGQLLGGSFGA